MILGGVGHLLEVLLAEGAGLRSGVDLRGDIGTEEGDDKEVEEEEGELQTAAHRAALVLLLIS